jgi:hypothetical protein
MNRPFWVKDVIEYGEISFFQRLKRARHDGFVSAWRSWQGSRRDSCDSVAHGSKSDATARAIRLRVIIPMPFRSAKRLRQVGSSSFQREYSCWVVYLVLKPGDVTSLRFPFAFMLDDECY